MMEDAKDTDAGTSTATADAAAAPVVTPDPRDAKIAALEANITALNDTVRGALQARSTQGTGGQAGPVTPQLRQALRQRGLSDADIDHNSQIILPYIEIFAPELVALVEGRVGPMDERMTLKEMADDEAAFPYAKTLRADMRKLIADAKKDGRTLSPEAAYHTAVSLDLGAGDKSKVREQDTQRRGESAGADASALSGLGHRTTTATGRRAATTAGPTSKADLSRMTREQRKEYFDKMSDAVIQ